MTTRRTATAPLALISRSRRFASATLAALLTLGVVSVLGQGLHVERLHTAVPVVAMDAVTVSATSTSPATASVRAS